MDDNCPGSTRLRILVIVTSNFVHLKKPVPVKIYGDIHLDCIDYWFQNPIPHGIKHTESNTIVALSIVALIFIHHAIVYLRLI